MYTMWFLLLSVVSGQPFYRETLRELPDKLRQQRIYTTVKTKVDFIQYRIVEEASNNRTNLNFTLYCFDPNLQYRETEESLKENIINGLHYTGKIYTYQDSIIQQKFPGQSLYEIQNTYGRPYYAYQRDGPRYRHSTEHDQHIKTELIYPRPYCNAKHGYELYQRNVKLEDTPQAYASLFFQILNTLFPDIHLSVSNKRPSEGLYDSDCCPLFTVSW